MFTRIVFPWLLRAAMRLGAREFARINARGHGWASRGWMWRHVWQPVIRRTSQSPTPVDDKFAQFVYTNQSLCLEDGTALSQLGDIRRAIAESDAVAAYKAIDRLQTTLGVHPLQRKDDHGEEG
jgi:hypothetical protein